MPKYLGKGHVYISIKERDTVIQSITNTQLSKNCCNALQIDLAEPLKINVGGFSSTLNREVLFLSILEVLGLL